MWKPMSVGNAVLRGTGEALNVFPEHKKEESSQEVRKDNLKKKPHQVNMKK